MGLGLGSTSIKPQNERKGVTRAWTDIGGLIGHWDFSDATNMATTIGGVTNPGNNDDIGEITNTAQTVVGNSGTPLLGRKLTFTVNYPKFKTGGANSKSYGDFDDVGLRCHQTLNAASTGVMSAADLAYNGATFYFVIDPSDATYSSDMRLFGLWGSTSDEEGYFGFGIEADDDETRVHTYDGTGPQQAHDTGIDNATGAQLWTLAYQETGSDATAAILYKDGDITSKYIVDMTAGGSHSYNRSQDIKLFDGAFCLGHDINGSGVANGSHWKGKIYEFLIYNKENSHQDNVLVEAYLKTKYGIS
jgi:hypothetical protein